MDSFPKLVRVSETAPESNGLRNVRLCRDWVTAPVLNGLRNVRRCPAWGIGPAWETGLRNYPARESVRALTTGGIEWGIASPIAPPIYLAIEIGGTT